jgi:hypothetical protein
MRVPGLLVAAGTTQMFDSAFGVTGTAGPIKVPWENSVSTLVPSFLT